MAIVRVYPTSVGFDGVGYYKDDRGRRYYGTPGKSMRRIDNEPKPPEPPKGPVREGDQPVEDAITRSMAPTEDALGFIGGIVGTIVAALYTVAAAAVLAAAVAYMVIMVPVYVVFSLIFLPWPLFLEIIVKDYQQGIVALPDIIVVVMTALLTVFLVICAVQVLTKKVMRMKRCFIVFAVTTFLVNAFFEAVSGGVTFFSVFAGLGLAVFPTLIIAFCEHLVTKEQRNDHRWFSTRIGQMIVPIFPGHAVGMILFGIANAVFVPLVIEGTNNSFMFSFLAAGTIIFALGVQAKMQELLCGGACIEPKDYYVEKKKPGNMTQ